MLTLKGYWYIAAAAHELRRQPIRRSVEGEQLALFRDEEGVPHALVDRCAHRGMALSCGRVRGDHIECPYHGWQYDGEGRLKHVPALCEGETPPQPKTMRSYPVVEQCEQIWVWIGEETPSDGPFHFPEYGQPGWATFFMQTRFEAPLDACLENFLDVPHTIFVHPGLFRGNDQQPTRVRIQRVADTVEAEFVDEPPLEGLGPRLFFPKGAARTHTDRFILPSITRVDYRFGPSHGFIITSQCTQRADDVVDVTTAITWRLRAPKWIVRPFARMYCRRVIQQDVDILKTLGKQLDQFGPTQLSTAADVLGGHIRRIRRDAAEGVKPTPHRQGICNETLLRI